MNRQTALIVTIASAVLCGCLGLLAAFMGLMFAGIGLMPGAEIDVFGSRDPASAMQFGLASVCGGLVLLAIPIALWLFVLRRAREVPGSPPPAPPAPPQ